MWFVLWSACKPEPEPAEDWLPCENADDGSPVTFECATLDGGVAAVRHVAEPRSDQWAIVASGGPGGSSIDLLAGLVAGSFGDNDPDLWRAVNWMAIDNRGVGQSGQIACVGDDWFDDLRARDPNPADDAARDGLVASADAFRAGCLADRSADDLALLGTPTYADDLDALRASVGADTVDFLGFSYGTWIGAVYAATYPEHVGRFVLDGVVAPDGTRDVFLRGQAEGFEVALERFFDRCADDEDCAVHDDPAGTFDALLAQARAEPLPAPTDPDGRTLSANDLRWAAASTLYGPYDEDFAEALAAAAAGDAGPMLAIADSGWDRDPETGAYGPTLQGYWAIGCVDVPWPDGWVDEDVWAFAAELDADWPRMGAALVTGELNCMDWPVSAPEPSLEAVDAAPLLLVGGAWDPATPLQGAYDLKDALGNESIVLEYAGDGHVAMFNDGCTYVAERGWILDGEAPPESCP
jgi:pimeloyl-ACP methyl ester carboxylesterase